MTEKEFTAAAEQHLDMVYRIALNCLRNPADAEDNPVKYTQVKAEQERLRAGVSR